MVVVAGGGSECKRIHMGGGGLGKPIECVPGGGWCRENNRNMLLVLVLVEKIEMQWWWSWM